MPAKKLKEYLDQNKVKFTSISHGMAYAAKEVSHVSHIPEKQFAKCVLVNAGKNLAMIVLPSNQSVDLSSLKQALHENSLTLAEEQQFAKIFSDCDLGAIPPFGNLYNIPVYVDKDLAKNKEIAFNAGTHTETIKLAYKDFINLVHPEVISTH